MVVTTTVPRSYQELTRTEIELLARLFSQSDQKNTQAFITDLPKHLKCVLPVFCSLCKPHKKLNPWVVADVFHSLRIDIQYQMREYWLPLNSASLLDAKLVEQIRYVYAQPFLVSGGCAGCNLAAMCRDVKFMVAAGAILLASMHQRYWKVSNRVFWLEACLRARIPSEHRDTVVQSMFELGLEMRKTRKEYKKYKDSCGKPAAEHGMNRKMASGSQNEIRYSTAADVMPPPQPTDKDPIPTKPIVRKSVPKPYTQIEQSSRVSGPSAIPGLEQGGQPTRDTHRQFWPADLQSRSSELGLWRPASSIYSSHSEEESL